MRLPRLALIAVESNEALGRPSDSEAEICCSANKHPLRRQETDGRRRRADQSFAVYASVPSNHFANQKMPLTVSLQPGHAAVVGVRGFLCLCSPRPAEIPADPLFFILPCPLGKKVISSAFVLQWMGGKVGAARKKYGIKYPKLYAESTDKFANEFNCVQRGHQNTIENYTMYVVFQLLSGVEYPLVSAAAGATYMLGRIFCGFQFFRGNRPENLLRLTDLSPNESIRLQRLLHR